MVKRVFPLLVAIAGLIFCLDFAARIVGEVFWFQEVGYLPVFQTRLQTQAAVWVLSVGATLSIGWGNLRLAQRLKYLDRVQFPRQANGSDRSKTPALGLGGLLFVGWGLGFLLSLMLLYYSDLALDRWHPDWNLPSIAATLPQRFNAIEYLRSLQPIAEYPLAWGVLAVFPVVILLSPRLCLRISTIALSLGFGVLLPAQWARILQAFRPTEFAQTDPLFGLDIAFYSFRLPVLELLEFWSFGVVGYCFVAVTLTYLLSGDSLSEGRFPGFSRRQQRHLQGLGGVTAMVLALSFWLQRYELLYSEDGVVYGASYTDVNVTLPAYTALALLAVAIAVLLLWQALTGASPFDRRSRRRPTLEEKLAPRRPRKTLVPPLYVILGGYAIAAGATTWLLPALVQRIVVQPNELARERPFIERSIAYTRGSFDLDNIEVETFNPTGTLDEASLKANSLTIRNIRLWDSRPLLDTNRQLQQIRLYYKFANADIDRYTIRRRPTPNNPQANETRQVILAARELDYSAVPDRAQTWVNQHLVYTHGYGFTMSPVNTATQSGLPEYFVKGIATEPTPGQDDPIEVTDPLVRDSIPIGSPRLYYGELTDTYVMTSTRIQELDYPSGDENVYNTYDGRGGIRIGTGWRRWLYAVYLRDWRMVLTENFLPETKLLFRRTLDRRVKSIAPFLRYDADPYLVTADLDPDNDDPNKNYLYWILDAYTTSDRYPYADPGDHSFNYIRNSVKVVIDAYNGSVQFYVVDGRDPILQTYQKLFPTLFQPLSVMPRTLLRHIRYPIDLFSVQSERLLIYHMTDPQVFYNREDQWQVPTEIYRNEEKSVEPYYLIMKLPQSTSEEFILLHPFTPRRRANSIAWLAGRSDGENYGKLLLYQFPKQELVYGPGQIEARINQDPVISQQLSLWNQQGSRVIQGNLLMIPIERSLLYVEPLYLEAEQNSLPTLARVIVAYENQIAMAPTLDRALTAIFEPEQLPARSIIRSIEGILPGAGDGEEETTETEE
ncbi:INTEGRAL MEMBRANE PROTEIN (Rhomboid family) [Geitlerinema sp. FC II]|nr:INTEGRAL MEMBRANE PROTEIN (Rhomboid family) [Geitlerinema sp. FC II]